MAMLKSFELNGKKQSFADWISNLSPCETPFISMIGKEKIDQVQYSWQTDRLASPDNSGVQEGSTPTFGALTPTIVNTNYTQIFRKAVRVTDTSKTIGLWGRGSELGYQMEKAGMEIKRDIEAQLLNSQEAGRPGTAALHGIAAGVQLLVAAKDAADADTGAVVHKVVTYNAGAGVSKFTQLQVFDLTYNLYLAGARANKVMFHPMHMSVFSDWIGNNAVTPHVHRMFDGMDNKYNAHVSTFRDPLGQVFELIPNRYMPKNQLFFFNEKDWTQMVLREPSKTMLGKTGSSEKYLIEMELGLRHRNPFASGILEFNLTAKNVLKGIKAAPANILGDNTVESTVTAIVEKADGSVGSATETVSFKIKYTNDDGTVTADTDVADVAPAIDNTAGSPTKGKAVVSTTVKHNKAARLKVEATVKDPADAGVAKAVVDTYDERD